MAPTATLLIVDDEAQNLKLLEALLRPEGYLTLTAASGAGALASVARRLPDLILLDVMMPGMDGYQVAGLLKDDPATSNIPIIMVTALIDRNARVAGLQAGVEEFLTKPIERDELLPRVRNLLRLKALGDFHRNHGAILEREVQARTAELQRIHAATDATADAIMLASRNRVQSLTKALQQCERLKELLAETAEELSSVKAALKHALAQRDPVPEGEEALEKNEAVATKVQEGAGYTALHDALTGLPNRALFRDRLEHGFAQAKRHGWTLAVMFLDLDDFKNINDSHGYDAGDSVLQTIALRLKNNVRGDDTVSRHGGDEFLYLLAQIQDEKHIASIAEKIIDAIEAPCDISVRGLNVSLRIETSIGISVFPKDGATVEALIKSADKAMYRAKQAKSGYSFAR